MKKNKVYVESVVNKCYNIIKLSRKVQKNLQLTNGVL